MIFAIDPGTYQSAWVEYASGAVRDCAIEPNVNVLQRVKQMRRQWDYSPLVIEMIACYGMPVGRETIETCLWIGRFIEASNDKAKLMYRKDVKLHLCNSMRAKDANVRQALLDLFPRTGGGATPQIGTKAKKGPLYGVRSHIWAALAVAVTYEGKVESEKVIA